MIVRVLRARVGVGRVSAFNAVFRRQVKLLREQPGLTYVKLARRLLPDGGEEAVLFEEWGDAQSLYAWVGPNLAEPRLVPGARELIEDIVVAHYESLSEDDHESFALPPVGGEAPTDTSAGGQSGGNGDTGETGGAGEPARSA